MGLSQLEKSLLEVYAVQSGATVKYSSSYSWQHIHYELDYSLNTPHGWCCADPSKVG